MNDKHNPNGSPKAIWIDKILGKNSIKDYITILPITDRYATHHGALGSCAWIHLNPEDVSRVIEILNGIEGVDRVITKKQAAKDYHLPREIIGDVVILGDRNTVLGKSPEAHKNVPHNRRSHGGLYEQKVPLIVNRPLTDKYLQRKYLHNKDIFELVINGTL